MVYSLIPIYSLLTPNPVDVFGNDTNKVIKVRVK